MSFLADFLMITGTCSVAFYCYILSKRLTRFTDLETGMGGAVAVLSMQVDDLNKALEKARVSSQKSAHSLSNLTQRAEVSANKLEIMLSTLHDLPQNVGKPDRIVQRSRRRVSETVS